MWRSGGFTTRCRKHPGIGGAAVLGAAVFAWCVIGLGTGWAKPSLADRIADERRELAALQQELDRIKKQRDLVRSKERSVAERLAESERVLAITRRALRLTEVNVDRKDRDLAESVSTLAERRQRAEETRRLARTRVRELAKWKGVYDGTFVVAAAPSEMAMRYDMVRRVVDRDRRLVRDAQAAAVAVSEQVAELERLRRDLEAVRAEERVALGEVLTERESRRRLLSELRTERIAYTRSIQDLEEASRRLEALIDDLARAARGPHQGVGLAKLKGRLIWPIQGEVVGLFGRQKHPRFQTYVDRKGIDIKIAQREAIRAVADGKVAYASPLKGYGNVVIIDHGDQYLSLYANASSIRVHPGDDVGAGEPLGEASAEGGDDRMYFELRHGKNPLDPLRWLLTRGGME
ncbi:MAG TPA: peptidoglycan DD-metalloendopeptidase family protein [Nitrospiria bacterium]|nr:peptidoglycan DD-metalloendopeptidase family protein [Nitrospiria bacterium]